MLSLHLKRTLSKNLKDYEIAYIDIIRLRENHHVKLSTNKLETELDRMDNRYYKAIKNVKVIYDAKKDGCLILKGIIQCSYQYPYGGELYITGAVLAKEASFESIKGYDLLLDFDDNHMTSINEMREALENIKDSDAFVYNLDQFDEFMELFEFYKSLSNELNNNITYEIASVSKPYYFVPVYIKDIDITGCEEVVNQDKVIIGHKIDDYQYEMLSSSQIDNVKSLVDIKIKNKADEYKRIRRFFDNIYVSNFKQINERNLKLINEVIVSNIKKDKEDLIISGEVDSTDFKYLNIYDMGQKIKVDSIQNSLRLIKQGASGAATELLEYLIGDKPMPSNNSYALKEGRNIYSKGLDRSQRDAYNMAIDGSPVSLIKGPPGTGKTYVINAMVQFITKCLNEKVIISSQTHVAIDNVLDELMENYDPIIPNRITNRKNKYSEKEIDFTLYRTWGKRFAEHNNRSSNESLKKALLKDMVMFKGDERFSFSKNMSTSDYSVIGATTTTAAIGGTKGLEVFEGYDWLIIDEVSKCPITEVLRYLPYVKRIIMVGDDFQLAPLLEFSKEEVEELPSYDEDKYEKLKKVYEESVFAKTLNKAKEAGRLVTLNVNYRSVKNVLSMYNVFYDNKLENARESVKPSKVRFVDNSIFNDKDVMFVEVKHGSEAKDGTSRYNIEEINATKLMLEKLLNETLNPQTVSVSAIFPYAAQIERFQKQSIELINKAKLTFKSFEIDTVDAFQGRETDIVLVNTVVTDSSQKNFLNDFRRINVSLSRARDKLIIFGNSVTLSKIEMKIGDGFKQTYFKQIIDMIRDMDAKVVYDRGDINYEPRSKIKIELA